MALAFDEYWVSGNTVLDRTNGGRGSFRESRFRRTWLRRLYNDGQLQKAGLYAFASDIRTTKASGRAKLKNARFKMDSIEAVKPWFEAVTELQHQYQYPSRAQIQHARVRLCCRDFLDVKSIDQYPA